MTGRSEREIGRKIAALRKERGWSQSALAALTEPPMDQSVLSRIEAGKRKLGAGELEALARALGIDAADLLRAERIAGAAFDAAAAFPDDVPPARAAAQESRLDLAAFTPDFLEVSAEAIAEPTAPALEEPRLAARLHSLREDVGQRAAAMIPERLADRLERRGREQDLIFTRAATTARETGVPELPELIRRVIADDLRLRALGDEGPASAASWASVDSQGRRRPAGKPSGGPAGRPAAAVSWNEPRDRYARLWRHELGIGVDGPVPDLVPLFEDAGVAEVIVARLDTHEPVCASVTARGATAAPQSHGEDVSFLFVNADRPVTLQRHALVHAFAHLALGHGDVVDRRVEWSRATPLEMEANDFAEEFLAPAAAVARWYDRHGDPRPEVDVLLDLAAAFGITFWAAYYRSRAAGRLGDKPAARLMHELRARQWQLLPEQTYGGGLRDTLSTLSEETPLPPSDAVGVGGVPPRLTRPAGGGAAAGGRGTGTPAVLRVPSGMRRRTLQALRGGRLSLEQAAAVLRRPPADLAAELERLGLE